MRYAPDILKEVVEATKLKARNYLLQLKEERVTLERDTSRWSNEIFKMTPQIGPNETDSPAIARLADLQERIQYNERWLSITRISFAKAKSTTTPRSTR